VRAWPLLLAVVAILAACGGDDEPAPAGPLNETAFADKAAAAIITGSELQAAAGSNLRVGVSADTSLNTFALDLEKPYAEYRARPAELDEILSGVVEDAETTMENGNAERTFAQVRSHVLPILKPITALRGLTDGPATTSFAGNLQVAYLVNRADSVTAITSADLERWKRSLEEIHRTAVANLLRQTNRDEPLRCQQKLCGWASGDGWDAARLLVPELRRQIVERIGPAVYAVPTESVYVALPIKLADRIRPRVQHDFVTARNPVSQDLFVERRGTLVVLRS
jgi:uncharacterized protein YtpQ (UPF0354 family)